MGEITDRILKRLNTEEEVYKLERVVQEWKGSNGDVSVFLAMFRDDTEPNYLFFIENGEKLFGTKFDGSAKESLMGQMLMTIRLLGVAFGAEQIGENYQIRIDKRAIQEAYAKSAVEKPDHKVYAESPNDLPEPQNE